MTASVGTLLAGRYLLEATIGRGGMGEVFAASNLQTGEQVAVKVVTRAALEDLLVQRLYREAQAAARIRSAHVPRLIEVARDDEGELFLVMERLYGETLGQRLRRLGGFVSWEEVSLIGEHVLLGLIDAHVAGVVHRDLKPGNIFLEYDGGPRLDRVACAKVLDFGVCKLDSHDVEHLTTTGEALGTIAYMAPEQIRGASKVDERADLYSFAMVVFEALSGRLAYDGVGQVALIAAKLERAARPLRELAQVPVPQGLDALLARALSRKAGDRFASAQEMLKAWRALGPATVMPRAAPLDGSANASMQTETVMTAGVMSATVAARTSRLGLVLAGTAFAGAFALLLFVIARQPSPRTAAVPAEVPTFESVSVPATTAVALPAEPPQTVTSIDADDSARPVASAPAPTPSPAPARSPRITRPRVTSPVPPKKLPPAGPHIQEQPRY